MTNAEIIDAIAQDADKKQGNPWTLLIISAALFAAAGALLWDFTFLILIAVAIFIHELGHLAAMKLYRYKNLKMMFLPFLGGVATGRSDEQNAYKIAVISLFGPLVGILSAYAAFAGWVLTQEPMFMTYAYVAAFINLFNLLPIMPLDGGHVVNETLFSRFPKVELLFKVFAIIVLGVLIWYFHLWLLGLVVLFLALSLTMSFKLADIARQLRVQKGFSVGELTEEKVQIIREAVTLIQPGIEEENKIRALPGYVDAIWTRTTKVFPRFGTTIALLAAYLVVILIGAGALALSYTAKVFDDAGASEAEQARRAMLASFDPTTVVQPSIFSDAFEAGYVRRDAAGFDYTFTPVRMGDLALPSGALLIGESLFYDVEEVPAAVQLTPGVYPVTAAEVLVRHESDVVDKRIGLIRVKVADAPAVRWRFIGTYRVYESGLGMLIDAQTLAQIIDEGRSDSVAEAVVEQMSVAQLDEVFAGDLEALRTYIEVPFQTANLFAYNTGFNSVYGVFEGQDAAGNVVEILTDLGTVAWTPAAID